jgi:hypothetical protein
VDAQLRVTNFASTPVSQTFDGRPVTVLLCLVRHDNAAGLKMVRLKVPQQPMLVALKRRHAVVADQRLREDEDLSTVRGVRHL